MDVLLNSREDFMEHGYKSFQSEIFYKISIWRKGEVMSDEEKLLEADSVSDTDQKHTMRIWSWCFRQVNFARKLN